MWPRELHVKLAEKCRALRLIQNTCNNSQFVEITRYFSLHDVFAAFAVCHRKRPKPDLAGKADRNPQCDKNTPYMQHDNTRTSGANRVHRDDLEVLDISGQTGLLFRVRNT